MRNLLLAIFCAGSFACATAQAANNDLVELGLGARLLFNSDVYAADNPGVNYGTDVFPIAGDEAFGIGFQGAIGHRFDSRRGPYEVLVKYIYSTSADDGRTVSVDATTLTSQIYEGALDQHDLILAFRLPGALMPLPILNWNQLYYDLGLGVTTLSYDYTHQQLVMGIPPVLTTREATRRTRTGLAFNLGAGWRHELSENTSVTLRADFIMGKIQDVKNAEGQVVQTAPNVHGARFQVGLVRYFHSLF
jgi:Outer membrane protein beta-barrel domain